MPVRDPLQDNMNAPGAQHVPGAFSVHAVEQEKERDRAALPLSFAYRTSSSTSAAQAR
ncbi:hypothetical protein DA2_3316 [Desulfovibrio sp. A2]|nr:hypothetical protein DA2_3316 [Desulfovibrio sp. A2]